MFFSGGRLGDSKHNLKFHRTTRHHLNHLQNIYISFFSLLSFCHNYLCGQSLIILAIKLIQWMSCMDKQNKQTELKTPRPPKTTTKDLNFVFGRHHCGNDVLKNAQVCAITLMMLSYAITTSRYLLIIDYSKREKRSKIKLLTSQ